MKQSEQDRAFKQLAKCTAKQRGWKSINGMCYWTIGSLFFRLSMTPRVKERAFHAYLSVKWLPLDFVLWDVLGIPDNVNEPFSLHCNGAFVLVGQEIMELHLTDVDWHPGRLEQEVAAAADSAARRALDLAADITSLEDYLAFLQRHVDDLLARRPHAAMTGWQEKALTALLQDDLDTAGSIACIRIAAGDAGGFRSNGLSFYENVLQTCARRRAASPAPPTAS